MASFGSPLPWRSFNNPWTERSLPSAINMQPASSLWVQINIPLGEQAVGLFSLDLAGQIKLPGLPAPLPCTIIHRACTWPLIPRLVHKFSQFIGLLSASHSGCGLPNLPLH